MSRRLAVGLSLVLVALLVAVVVGDRRASAARSHEWRHGGDDVVVRAAVGATDGPGYGDLLAAAGAPPGGSQAEPPAQGFVVHVEWDGTPSIGDRYVFVLLDRRLSPPEPIRAVSAWSRGEATGAHWDGRYEALSEHYPWLAATASRRTPGSWTTDADAVGAPAASRGEAILAFWGRKDGLPSERPAQDLVLAMVLVDAEGEPRWARRIMLEPLRQS